MNIYTTCRRCGGSLLTTDGDTVHPLCDPKPTKAEQLAQQWLHAIEAGDGFTADALEYDIETLDTRGPRLLDAALRYASWGWPVFPLREVGGRCDGGNKCQPLCQCPKKPATRNGFKDATTDPVRIRQWWTEHPRGNIGLPTGLSFDVIDIDVPGGAASLAAMLERDVLPDVHGHVATGSGGAHYYTPTTGRGNTVGLLPGIDYRGVGGYVVAPPSTLGVRGRAWSWVSTPSPKLTSRPARAVA